MRRREYMAINFKLVLYHLFWRKHFEKSYLQILANMYATRHRHVLQGRRYMGGGGGMCAPLPILGKKLYNFTLKIVD